MRIAPQVAALPSRRGLAGPPSPATAYLANRVVSYGGHTWRTTAAAPRGVVPAGFGDGSTADRNLLLLERNGWASPVTGGYAGGTYTVTSTADSGPGTLRFALERTGADWIVFDKTVFPPGIETMINLSAQLIPRANKTVDGRGSKVKIKSTANILIQGIGNPTVSGSAFVRFPGAVANIIFAYVDVEVTSSNLNRDAFTMTYGTDLVWLHHIDILGGTDGAIDISNPTDGGVDNLWGESLPTQVRITISWVKQGPMPSAANLAITPPTGGDNRPENGKTNLIGLQLDTHDIVKVTFDHVWWHGAVQRNPKVWYGANAHILNSYVDRWGLVPGVVANAGHQAFYTALGKPAPVIATYGTVGTDVSHDARVLLQNTVYRPYAVDEAHVLDATWPMHYAEADGLFIDGSTLTSGGIRTAGLLLDGATRNSIDVNPGNVPEPGYAYTLLTADADLVSDLVTGCGNYQPWQLVA